MFGLIGVAFGMALLELGKQECLFNVDTVAPGSSAQLRGLKNSRSPVKQF